MTTSNLDLARECGAAFPETVQGRPGMTSVFTTIQLDAFAERIRADERAAQPSPAAVERKPLTNAQIFEAIKAVGLVKNQAAIAGARAIERAHGITEQQGEPS